MKRGFFSLTGILLVHLLIAQHVKQFSFRHFSTTNGLAANEVRTTVQDGMGFIWLGTADGLQRFDGTRFYTFRHVSGHPRSLPANAVSQLMLDKQKNMWVLFDNGKIGIMDVHNFRFTEIPVKIEDERNLRADKEMYHDLMGNIIFLLKGQGIFLYNENLQEFLPAGEAVKTPPGWKVFAIEADTRNKKYWIGADSGLAVFDPVTRHISFAGHNTDKSILIEKYGRIRYIYNLFTDSRQRLWFETWPPGAGAGLLFCATISTGEPVLENYDFSPLLNQYHEIRNPIEQKDGSIWIKGMGVFARYNETEKYFTVVHNGYLNEQGISYDVVNQLYEDREQNIWVSTSNNGTYLFNPHNQLFTVINHMDRTQNVVGKGGVMSFASLNDGTVLAGAWGNGIFRYDSLFNDIPVNIKGIDEKNYYNAWSMCRLHDNRTIWMSLQPGIMIYDQQTNSAQYHNPPILENRTTRQVVEDKYGNVWLGTQNRGLIKWTRSKAIATGFNMGFEKLHLVPNTNVNKIISDNKGFLWACTSLDGIYKIDPASDSVVEHINGSGPSSKRLLDNACATVMQYNDSIFMISAGGLNIYNTRSNTIRHITTENGLPSDGIVSMEKDNNGNLWLGLVNGLCRVNLAKNKFSYYNRNDGFINDNFLVSSSYHLPDGRLLFGTIEDFIVFDPSKVRASSPPPNVVITDVRMTDNPVPLDSILKLNRIELPYYHNSLFIEFAGLTYQNKDKVSYYYMLEGLDKEWKKADELNQATYSYLPPNSYTFKVKIETGDGMENRHITSLKIRIKPPFWRTWWFVSLLAFAALSLFLYMDRQRVQRLRSIIKMRSRIAANFTKDLGSTLGNINVLSEMAKVKADIDSERTKEYVNQISDNSSRMIEVMDDMIWSIRPENDELEYIITRMTTYAAGLHAKYDVEIHFEFGDKVREIKLPMDQRHELYTIFKEAITNAAKHSQAKYIDVAIACHKSKLCLRIQDEGKGFDTGAMSFGRGLNDMQKKASALRARLTIQSEINTGTIVLLDMPM